MSSSTTNFDVLFLATLTQTERFHSLAALSWLLYDYMLSLNDEVGLIWRSATTAPKLLYFISRYFGLIVQVCAGFQIIPFYCEQGMIFNTVTMSVIVFSVELSLAFRVYALYTGSRLVLSILILTATVQISCVATINALADVNYYPKVIPFPTDWPIHGCFFPGAPAYYNANWIPTLGYETMLFILMCIKCYSYRPLHEVPIVLRIWRDGTTYYFVIFATLLICALFQYIPNNYIDTVASIWVGPIYSYSGSHLLLSVRKLAAERQRLEVLTPDLSEVFPDSSILGPLDVNDETTNSESYELQSTQGNCDACSPHASGSTTMLRRQIQSYSGWLQQWDARPARSKTIY